jgi:hypothetical protein
MSIKGRKNKNVRPDKLRDEDFEKALRACKGLLYIAADHMGCSTSTMSRAVAASKHLQDVIHECRERRLDQAELKLAQRTDDGSDLGAICFTLKTLGKHRGYVEGDKKGDFDLEKLQLLADFMAKVRLMPSEKPSSGASESKDQTDQQASA